MGGQTAGEYAARAAAKPGGRGFQSLIQPLRYTIHQHSTTAGSVRIVAQRNDIVTSSSTLTAISRSQKIFFCTAIKV